MLCRVLLCLQIVRVSQRGFWYKNIGELKSFFKKEWTMYEGKVRCVAWWLYCVQRCLMTINMAGKSPCVILTFTMISQTLLRVIVLIGLKHWLLWIEQFPCLFPASFSFCEILDYEILIACLILLLKGLKITCDFFCWLWWSVMTLQIISSDSTRARSI